jgi:hypothetical protein
MRASECNFVVCSSTRTLFCQQLFRNEFFIDFPYQYRTTNIGTGSKISSSSLLDSYKEDTPSKVRIRQSDVPVYEGVIGSLLRAGRKAK